MSASQPAGSLYQRWYRFFPEARGIWYRYHAQLAPPGMPCIPLRNVKPLHVSARLVSGLGHSTIIVNWLPNHLLIVHILVLFAVLNPLVIPFGFLYFCVESVVVKNQLLHVYARNYEGNGQTLLIRLIRYSSDGLMLSQAVFLAYMVVLKRTANVVVAAVLIVLTILFKLSLTRFCRVKFERDDLAEARILCGTSIAEDDSPEYAEDLTNSPMASEEERPSREGSPPERQSRLSYLTWRLSRQFGFSYAATLPRRHKHQRRQPNPFQPRSSADSGVPLHPCSSTSGLVKKATSDLKPTFTSMLQEEPIYELVQEPEQISPDGHEETQNSLVTLHPCHPAWDDEPNPNTPYDNPYYTRPISDTLWLPRNPLGILDLDDTIDMRISITSEPGAGRLGLWQEDEFIGSVLSSVFATSFGSVDDDSSSTHHSIRHLHGNEVIQLPAGIASRVESLGREQVIDANSSSRQSLLGPRRSSNSGAHSVRLRRPSTAREVSSPSDYRSFSLNAESNVSLHVPTASQLPSPRPRFRSHSIGGLGLGVPSDVRIPLGPRVNSIRSAMRSSSGPQSIAAGSVISTRDAVVGEAIAEEQVAADERLRQEVEIEKAKESRSWLTSWMYSSAH